MTIDFCILNDLVMANTFFEYMNIKSRNKRSIIDPLLIKRTEFKELKNVRVKRSYKVGSYHYLVEIKRQELRRQKNHELENKTINIIRCSLQQNYIKLRYQAKIANITEKHLLKTPNMTNFGEANRSRIETVT